MSPAAWIRRCAGKWSAVTASHGEGHGLSNALRKTKTKMEELRRPIENVYTGRGRIFRVVWVGIAILLLVLGLAMAVLPGPALIVIPIGLIMLSIGFPRSRKLLDEVFEKCIVGAKRIDRLAASKRASRS